MLFLLICRYNVLLVNRIKQETGVLINVPFNEVSDVIRIEGDINGVAKAKGELLEMAKKMVRDLYYVR